MRFASLVTLSATLVALSACMTDGGPESGATQSVLGSGILSDTSQATIGTVSITRGASGNEVAVSVSSMTPGTYGIHLHTTGRCDLPAFASAGAHWNPTIRQHGRLNPQGTHHGDLPNLVVASNGSGQLKAPFVGALTGEGGLFDADGAAVVLHARPDDERTDPSGNSGDRIACAVLTPT